MIITRLAALATIPVLAFVATLGREAPACETPPVPATPVAAAPRPIDLAICLDTSGSMSGLIDAARQKLWAIVNDLALVTPTPRLRVALVTYGNSGHLSENGWVEVQSTFTEDLDLISEKLFALSTDGGTEYVGRVLQHASRLDWAPGDGLRMVILAGNEAADQDPDLPFRDVCRALIARDIIVNSIYCGGPADPAAPGWQDVAKYADGRYASIDHNQGTVVIATPFDEQITELSASINETYLPYGAAGTTCAANQVAQDWNASQQGAAIAASRGCTKGGALYRNAHWDLVDASDDADFDLATIDDALLPETMQAMNVDERRVHVASMKTRRAEIRQQIADLSGKRRVHIDIETKKLGDSRAFDSAVRRAVRDQAKARGFGFAETAAKAEPKETDASSS